MMLKNKYAVVYGAGGAVGSAMARALARDGARVFLTGRTLAKVEAVVRDIARDAGAAEAAEVDTLDERAVEKHLDTVIERVGRIDISFNAMGIPQHEMQGIPLAELSAESFSLPIASYTRGHFLTARAAVRRMVGQKSGVILMHTPEPARQGTPLIGGMSPAWAAMETLCRNLSAECAPHGVRAVCLRSTGMPETATIDVVFGLHAKALGITREEFQNMMAGMTHRGRATGLEELTNVAVFMASDRASAMTGTIVNLTGGKFVD